MATKIKHSSEEEVMAALEQAAVVSAKLEKLIDDETSSPRIATAREKKLYHDVAFAFKMVSLKYEVMNAIRFADHVEFV